MIDSKIVQELDLNFDHTKILSEFLSIRNTTELPREYVTEEVLNNGVYPKRILDQSPYSVEVCESMKKEFKFNFVLFRCMPPLSTLGWHIDGDCDPFSYHIPVVNNSGCFYVLEEINFRLPKLGQVYKVYTHFMHTFINAGTNSRLHMHFIFDIRGTYLSREWRG